MGGVHNLFSWYFRFCDTIFLVIAYVLRTLYIALI